MNGLTPNSDSTARRRRPNPTLTPAPQQPAYGTRVTGKYLLPGGPQLTVPGGR